MKELYRILQEALQDAGYRVGNYGENNPPSEEINAILTMEEMNPIENGFAHYQASITIQLINGTSWDEDFRKISEVLLSFIPMEDRYDGLKTLPDRSDKMILLDIPVFSDISIDIDEDTAEETHGIAIELYLDFN